ncbi:MAG: hypothetical protein ACM3JI_05310 [Anaerolineae bacterium]
MPHSVKQQVAFEALKKQFFQSGKFDEDLAEAFLSSIEPTDKDDLLHLVKQAYFSLAEVAKRSVKENCPLLQMHTENSTAIATLASTSSQLRELIFFALTPLNILSEKLPFSWICFDGIFYLTLFCCCESDEKRVRLWEALKEVICSNNRGCPRFPPSPL